MLLYVLLYAECNVLAIERAFLSYRDLCLYPRYQFRNILYLLVRALAYLLDVNTPILDILYEIYHTYY